MITFKGDYNRGDFYCIMGKFFAERKYRKIMEYLFNENNSVWHIEIKNNKVIGFINYVKNNKRASIGYCYIDASNDDIELEKNLLEIAFNECKDKDIYVEIEKNYFKADGFLDLGFKVYKESKNYLYLVRRVEGEDISK